MFIKWFLLSIEGTLIHKQPKSLIIFHRVDSTDNTYALVKQFGDDTKLIVTTIQKLNNAITNQRYVSIMSDLREKIVFIFDECHRSQFGETQTH